MSNLAKVFTELEQAVMAIVWKLHIVTAEQVREHLEPTHTFKESTVRTLLSRLEQKGHLRHTLEGRTYLYSAVEGPHHIAVRAVKQIVEKFCAGSVEQLLVGMVNNDLISPMDLRRLAQKIQKKEVEPLKRKL